MSTNQRYSSGVLREQWSNGAQPGDPAAGYTSFNPDGTVASARALTAGETTQLAAQDSANAAAGNQATLQTKMQAALVANVNDVAQDQSIQTQAATITAASITNLAAAAAAIGKLAQAVSLLAGNDINTKKELQALVRIVLQQFDSTAGT